MTSTDPLTKMTEKNRIIELPKSHLVVAEGHLLKQGDDGEAIIAMHPLEKISRVRIQGKFDESAVWGIIIFAVLAAAAKLLIPSATWGWVAAIPLGLVALIALIACRTTKLVVQLGNEAVTYSVQDEAEDARGFEATVNSLLSDLRSKR